MIPQVIGEALIAGLQAVVLLGGLLFVRSLYRDVAGLCSGKDMR
jgi:hypothetical protein